MTVPFIRQRGDELRLMPGGHETHSLGAIAPALGGEAFASQTPAIGRVFGVVNARFVEIHPLMGLVLRSFTVVGLAFLAVPFGIEIALCLGARSLAPETDAGSPRFFA